MKNYEHSFVAYKCHNSKCDAEAPPNGMALHEHLFNTKMCALQNENSMETIFPRVFVS